MQTHFSQLSEETMEEIVDVAVARHSVIEVALATGKNSLVYPHRLVHFEDGPCIVGEDVHGRSLVTIALSDVASMAHSEFGYTPNFGPIEIDDFLASVQAVEGSEIRLVLKIRSSEKPMMNVQHHFFGNPYMVTNPEGDVIWAASIVPGPELFDWVLSLGPQVEIMAPVSFKLEFLRYCESKLRGDAA